MNESMLKEEDQIAGVVKIIIMKDGAIKVTGFPLEPATSLEIMSKAQLILTNFWLKKAVDGEMHHGEGSRIIVPDGVFVPQNLTKKVQ